MPKIRLPSWLLVTLGGVREEDKLVLTKNLAVMLKSGIPIAEALEVLEKQVPPGHLKEVLSGVGEGVKGGQTLEKSLAKYPEVFDVLYRNIVGVGEESGNLEKNLDYLETTLTKAHEFRKKVQTAMLYPELIVVTAMVVGGGVTIFVLPKLADLFKSLEVELPFSTKALLWISDVTQSYGGVILVGMVALGIGVAAWSKSKWGQPVWHRVLLNLPGVGRMLTHIQLAVFCRNLGLMLTSAVPIVEALGVTARASPNWVFREYGERLKAAVEKGISIEKELESGAYKLMPATLVKMVGMGERTGKLDEIFLYLGDFWDKEVDEQMRNITSVLEPVLLIFIAAGVAFLAMAIISPIYQLTAAVKR